MLNIDFYSSAIAGAMGLDVGNIELRKKFIGLGAEDAALLGELRGKLGFDSNAFIDAFHAQLHLFPEAHRLLGPDPGKFKHLKQKQAEHYDRLAGREYDLDCALDRLRLTLQNQQSGLKPQWYLGVYSRYLAEILPQVLHLCGNDPQQFLKSCLALIKVAMLDMQLSVEAHYQSEHMALRTLSQVFESNTEGIFITDMEGRIQHANKTISSICGYTPEELVGKDWQSLYAVQPTNDLGNAWLQALAEGRWQGEATLWHKSGKEFPAWLNLSAIQDGRGQASQVIVQFSDITAFKQTQDELAKRTEELANSNRELEQFAYVASHDLQEPLRMVASYTQLLARRYQGKLDEDADEFIHYAVDGATRMQGLINDLLTLSRVGTRGKPLALCSSGTALDLALTNLRVAIAESGAEVTHDAMPELTADTAQLTQLFQNLIGNALKFRGEAPPKVHVGTEKKSGKWQFSIRDNGIGIAPEFFERIFVIFQRLHGKHEYPGTGIGLSVCKKVVERHGGKIWLESEPGKGTVFYFTIPADKKRT